MKVTCAIIINRGKILVVRNGPESDHPYQWEFPGGKINNGETPGECISREIMEELGISIRILKKMHVVQWDYGFKKIELIPFLCAIKTGDIKLTEHVQFLWKDFESLPGVDLSEADCELIKLPANKKILEEYFRENMDNARQYSRPSQE